MTEAQRGKKIMTACLRLFYHANPRQLELLCVKMHRNAMHDAAFAKLILDRVEGPVAQQIQHTGEISHIVSESDRQGAQDAVRRIMALQESAIDVTPELPAPEEKNA
jgi:hypothetical protein